MNKNNTSFQINSNYLSLLSKYQLEDYFQRELDPKSYRILEGFMMNFKEFNFDLEKKNTAATFCNYYLRRELLILPNQFNFIKVYGKFEIAPNWDLNVYHYNGFSYEKEIKFIYSLRHRLNLFYNVNDPLLFTVSNFVNSLLLKFLYFVKFDFIIEEVSYFSKNKSHNTDNYLNKNVINKQKSPSCIVNKENSFYKETSDVYRNREYSETSSGSSNNNLRRNFFNKNQLRNVNRNLNRMTNIRCNPQKEDYLLNKCSNDSDRESNEECDWNGDVHHDLDSNSYSDSNSTIYRESDTLSNNGSDIEDSDSNSQEDSDNDENSDSEASDSQKDSNKNVYKHQNNAENINEDSDNDENSDSDDCDSNSQEDRDNDKNSDTDDRDNQKDSNSNVYKHQNNTENINGDSDNDEDSDSDNDEDSDSDNSEEDSDNEEDSDSDDSDSQEDGDRNVDKHQNYNGNNNENSSENKENDEDSDIEVCDEFYSCICNHWDCYDEGNYDNNEYSDEENRYNDDNDNGNNVRNGFDAYQISSNGETMVYGDNDEYCEEDSMFNGDNDNGNNGRDDNDDYQIVCIEEGRIY